MKKNDLYRVFDAQFNKNEMYQKIKNTLDKKKRKQIIFKCSLISIAFIFVILGFFMNKSKFDDKSVLNEQDNVKDKIYINEIDQNKYDNVSNLDVRILDISNSSYEVSPISTEIPSDLKLDTIYIVYVKDEQTGKYDIVHDIIESYTGKERAVNISYSSIGEVLRDVDIPKGNFSIVHDVEVMISKNDETLIGQFKYLDIYYDIETWGLTSDEFLDIIDSIIK